MHQKISGLTFEERTDPPDGNGAEGGELTKRHLQEEYGEADCAQRQNVGNQEGAWKINKYVISICILLKYSINNNSF